MVNPTAQCPDLDQRQHSVRGRDDHAATSSCCTAGSPKQIVGQAGHGDRARAAQHRRTNPRPACRSSSTTQGLSQPGVGCPSVPGGECAVALGTTDADGGVQRRRSAGGQPARVQLRSGHAAGGRGQPAAGGRRRRQRERRDLGRPRQRSRASCSTPSARGVAGAQVGGGRTLVVTDATGHFTLPDVPLGRREIVAVSDALATSGRANVDITRAGEEVAVTIVLDSVGSGRRHAVPGGRCDAGARRHRLSLQAADQGSADRSHRRRRSPTRTVTTRCPPIPLGRTG